MSYDLQSLFETVKAVDTGSKYYVNAVGSTGVSGEIAILKQAEIRRIYYWVKVASVMDTAAAVITIRLRPTFGSATGQTTLGTLTIPDLSAIGKIVFKDITPVVVPAGYTIAIDLTTAGTSAGSAAGTGVVGFDLLPVAEDYRSEGNMVKSA